MGWKDWSYWLKLGLILAFLNIIISLIPYNMEMVKNPESFSDLVIYAFPNILLGFPAIIISEITLKTIIIEPLAKSILAPQFKNKETGLTDFISLNNSPELMRIRLGILLFFILTIYWFIIGALIGWIVGKIKSKK